jgi:hypothetical protein
MNEFKKEFITFCRRVVSLHVIVYFLAGIFALLCLNYEELFSNETTSLLMRPVDSPIVAAGPGLQIINGFMMSLYLFRRTRNRRDVHRLRNTAGRAVRTDR